MIPSQVVYGREPPNLLRFESGSTTNFDVEKMLKERDAMLLHIKEYLIQAQGRMKNNTDKHRRELKFEVGDKVFLKLRLYRQQSVSRRLCQNLAACFYGPFEVLRRVCAVAYRLRLPGGSRIHPMFHISQLKPVLGIDHLVLELPTVFSENDEVVIEPDEILDSRYDATGHLEVLVRWKGLPDHENSWTRAVELIKQFPHLKLEGGVLISR